MDIIRRALEEDIGKGDITTDTLIPKNLVKDAYIICKEECILCGIKVCEKVFKEVDKEVVFNPLREDGEKILPEEPVATLHGRVASILKAERTALNFLMRLSGIATLTRQFVEKVEDLNVKILDTRKTTPCLRELEKYAVKVGGGENHRMGLYDAMMIKDNHISSLGGIEEALKKIPENRNYKVIVEVKNLEELTFALKYSDKIDRVLLDNMSVDEVKRAVDIVKGAFELEVSGGINLSNIRDYAKTGVNFISIGMLTHSFKSINFSLEIGG